MNFVQPFSLFNYFKPASFCCSYKPIDSDLVINFDENNDDVDNTKINEREIKDNLSDSFNDLVMNFGNNLQTDF